MSSLFTSGALRRRQMAGFTLIEILIAMTLLSVVMLALGAAMRTIAQSEERIDRRLERTDEFRIADEFIRATLGRVSARKIAMPLNADAIPFLFSAAPDSVSWIGIMPARYGAGGRYFFHLGVESAGDESSLVLRFAPWTGEEKFPDWSQADAQVLVNGVTSLAIQYEDGRPVPSIWGPGWDRKEYLPQRLVMQVQTVAGPWPDLVAPLRTMPAEDGGGGASLGGR